GRFMRVDPLGALNPYVYCGNDPLNFVDPSGLYWQSNQVINVWGFSDGDGWGSGGGISRRGAGGLLDASGTPFQYTFDSFYEKRARQFQEACRENNIILKPRSPFDNDEIQGGPLLACACDGTEGVVTDVPMLGASLAPIGYAEHSYCVKLENCKADALEILEGDLKAIESLMNDYYAGDPFTREYLKIRYEIEGYILFTGMRLQVYGKYWGSYNKCELKWRLPCIVEIPHVQ
ncbi:hypothetical protein KAW48_05175, partial [candidate division WOR-3 bacterium]|nr:hypothetical protein [candidate division WOR-3 bacterium]